MCMCVKWADGARPQADTQRDDADGPWDEEASAVWEEDAK